MRRTGRKKKRKRHKSGPRKKPAKRRKLTENLTNISKLRNKDPPKVTPQNNILKRCRGPPKAHLGPPS